MRSGFYIAGLGASAGGHDALKTFFQNLIPDSGVAFVVITHLLRGHKSMLDRILQRHTAMPVRRIQTQQLVEPDTVYVLPEDSIAFIRGGVLVLRRRPESLVINKAVDIFFHSLAEDQKERAIGIVFSGMGDDGAEGALSIHNNGGKVLVQAPHSTRFSSMPLSAMQRDHPVAVLTPAELAKALPAVLRFSGKERVSTKDLKKNEPEG